MPIQFASLSSPMVVPCEVNSIVTPSAATRAFCLAANALFRLNGLVTSPAVAFFGLAFSEDASGVFFAFRGGMIDLHLRWDDRVCRDCPSCDDETVGRWANDQSQEGREAQLGI